MSLAPPRALPREWYGSNSRATAGYIFEAQGTKWVTTLGIPKHAKHFVEVGGSNWSRVVIIPSNYRSSVENKEWGDFMSSVEYYERDGTPRSAWNDRVCLCVWDEVGRDFGPEYVEGKPEWGEVCL